MNSIQIIKIKGNLNEDGNDVYFKILLGPNLTKTSAVKSAKRDFVFQEKLSFYAEAKENKITFVMFDKDVVSDDYLGTGFLALDGLTAGEKSVTLKK